MPNVSQTSATVLVGDVVYSIADANTTADDDLSGSSTATVYGIEIASSATNTSFLKLWDNNNPTVGTTAPDLILPIAANTSQTLLIGGGILFSNLSAACVDAGGVGSGASSPAGTVTVEIVVDEA